MSSRMSRRNGLPYLQVDSLQMQEKALTSRESLVISLRCFPLQVEKMRDIVLRFDLQRGGRSSEMSWSLPMQLFGKAIFRGCPLANPPRASELTVYLTPGPESE
jgi:hypothetical protein